MGFIELFFFLIIISFNFPCVFLKTLFKDCWHKEKTTITIYVKYNFKEINL